MISTEKDFGVGLTSNVAVGAISCDELLNWIAAYYAGPATKNILWDFTEADISGITADEFRGIAVEVEKRSAARIGGKTAFVFSRDVDFGLGRMITTFGELEGLRFEVRNFRDISAARKWLGV